MYKLLVVDDEALIRRGIKGLIDLKQLEIDQVFEASNGQDGLEVFKQKLPDLVLADINMPKLNGLDFAKEIKRIKPEVKIAIITGYDYFDYAVKALKIGIDDYILKPVSRKDITKVLLQLIEKIKNQSKEIELEKVVTRMKQTSGINEETGYKKMMEEEIDANLSNSGFSLSHLADYMGFSVGYLSGLFKKLFGESFQDYVINKRLNQAKLLLLTTQLKNYEIAEQIGFEDPNYFSVRFKKKFGYSPKQYKEKARGK